MMQWTSTKPYKEFFWKRFFILFIPLVVLGILSEPMIIHNPFEELEDYGAFVFFLSFYVIVLGGWAAFITSLMWRVRKLREKKE